MWSNLDWQASAAMPPLFLYPMLLQLQSEVFSAPIYLVVIVWEHTATAHRHCFDRRDIATLLALAWYRMALPGAPPLVAIMCLTPSVWQRAGPIYIMAIV